MSKLVITCYLLYKGKIPKLFWNIWEDKKQQCGRLMVQLCVQATSFICDDAPKQAKEKTVIASESWKYKHYFGSIWSKSKTIVVPCLLCA